MVMESIIRPRCPCSSCSLPDSKPRVYRRSLYDWVNSKTLRHPQFVLLVDLIGTICESRNHDPENELAMCLGTPSMYISEMTKRFPYCKSGCVHKMGEDAKC